MGKRAANSDRYVAGSTDDGEQMDNGFDDFNAYRTRPSPHSSRIVAAGTSMDRLIQDIKRKIRKTKDFWAKLPNGLCSNNKLITGTRDASAKSCWNGTDIVQ